MSWHHLVKGTDAGGVRYFLDGRGVHAGDGLDLRLPRGRGPLRVRFEVEHPGPGTFGDAGTVPVLYLNTGCDPYPLDAGDPDGGTDDIGPALAMRPSGAAWDTFELRWPERG